MKTWITGILSCAVLVGILLIIGVMKHNLHFTQHYMVVIGGLLSLLSLMLLSGMGRAARSNRRMGQRGSTLEETKMTVSFAGIVFLTGFPCFIASIVMYYTTH